MIERDVSTYVLRTELAERLIDPYLKTRPIAIISSSHKMEVFYVYLMRQKEGLWRV